MTIAAEPKAYSLPERGFARHRVGLVVQVVFLGLLAIALAVGVFFVCAGSATLQSMAAVLAVFGLLFLLIGPFLVPRAQRALWRQVEIEVGATYVATRHQGAPIDVRILPQQEVRVEREQIVGIQKTPRGLVIATRYDSQALLIPAQLADADYQEIISTLSAWCPIESQPGGLEGAFSTTWARFQERVQLARREPLFYDRAYAVFGAAVLVGCLVSVIPGVFIIAGWSEGRQVPTSLGLAILSIYLAAIVGSVLGACVGFGWLDYGLARLGLSRPTRSAVWSGTIATVMISAFAIALGLSPWVGLAMIIAGALLVAGLAWLLTLPQADPGARSRPGTAADQVPAILSQVTGTPSDGAIQGAYRLTFDQFYLAAGTFAMTQPRFWGRPRLLSVCLPRSVDCRSLRLKFSSYPQRNKMIYFLVQADSITWVDEDHSTRSVDWEQVKRVTRMAKGFLLHRTGPNPPSSPALLSRYDWLPFHAFLTEEGPQVFARLARRQTQVEESV